MQGWHAKKYANKVAFFMLISTTVRPKSKKNISFKT